MRLPCEPIVHKVLPAVRSLVANELQARGYTQEEIAAMIGLTQPAVSQYVNADRGRYVQQIEEHEEAYSAVTAFVSTVVQQPGADELRQELHALCTDLLETDIFDGAKHRQH